MLGNIAMAVNKAAKELIVRAGLTVGKTVVVGCSTSEIAGYSVGTSPNAEIGFSVFDSLNRVFEEYGIILAAQCCEHLNRALVVERTLAEKNKLTIVCAMPQEKAGGSVPSAAWKMMADPVLVEFIVADAGIDIGDTFVGMHLKHVAVPVRLPLKQLGSANVTFAKTRPKYIGGERARY